MKKSLYVIILLLGACAQSPKNPTSKWELPPQASVDGNLKKDEAFLKKSQGPYTSSNSQTPRKTYLY